MRDPGSYLVLKLSQALFQKAPGLLAPKERQRVEQVASRQLEIEQRILATLEAAQIHVPEASLNAAVAEIRGRYATRAEYLADLVNAGLDESTLRVAIARDLRFEAVLERVASREAKVSDLDAEIFYFIHREKFRRPENRTLRHILVTINDDLPGSDRVSAWRHIEALQTQLKNTPDQFADLALKHSECPTAMQGGLLGTLRRGQLYPELEPVAFALRLGELSEIVESPMGFHLLYCVAIEDESFVPFSVVREKIRAHLSARRQKAAQRQWIASLFGQAEMVTASD